MPNLLKSVLVRRFLAHSLEISVVFAISLITLSIVSAILNSLNISPDFYSTGLEMMAEPVKTIDLNNDKVSEVTRYSSILSEIYNLLILFTLFYFIFTAFNFFVSFTMLYPKNNYKVGIAYKLFGFSHFDFGRKKLSHFKKSLKIIYRELVLAATIYGLFFIISLLNIQIVVRFLSNFMGYGNSFLDLTLTVFYLFCIFVLPAFILSLVTLKMTKGKQFFWDYISGVTMK